MVVAMWHAKLRSHRVIECMACMCNDMRAVAVVRARLRTHASSGVGIIIGVARVALI